MPRFFDQADLERAVGGAQQLKELLDKNHDDVPDEDLVLQAIDAASNEIASYIHPTIDLDSLARPYPLALVFKSADAGAFYAWRYGSYGQGIPDAVTSAYQEAIRWAKDVGAKRATLGSQPNATLYQPVGVVDHDPNGTGVSVKGFKRGFR